MKVQSQQRSYFRWLSIRHKTITLHRHQKDFLDKLVVKENSLKETFKQRKLLRTRFGKKHIREEFLPWKSKLCSCVPSFFFLTSLVCSKLECTRILEVNWNQFLSQFHLHYLGKTIESFERKRAGGKRRIKKIVLGAENLFMVCLVCRLEVFGKMSKLKAVGTFNIRMTSAVVSDSPRAFLLSRYVFLKSLT